MREPASPEAIDSRSIFRGVWLWPLLVLLALGIAAIVALPYGLRYGLEQWFYAQGATRVAVGKLETNPLTGGVHVRNLVVEGSNAEVLRASDLRFKFLWQSLWHRRFAFDTVTVRGAKLRFDNPAIASLRHAGDSSWPVNIRSLQLSDVEFLLPSGDQNISWRIRQGTLEPWSSRAEDQIKISLQGDLAGAPLRVQGTFNLAAPVPEGDGELEIDNLKLSRIASLAPTLRELQGIADAKLRIRLLRDVEGHLELANEGTIRLHDLRATGDGAQLQSGETLWAGEGEVQLAGGGAGFHQQGQWKSTQLQLATPGGTYRTDSAEWHGQITARIHLRRPPTITADGALDVQTLEAHSLRTDLSLHARRAQWRGLLSEGVLDVPGGVTATGQLKLFDLQISRPEQKVVLFDATQASLRDLDLKGTYSVSAQALEILHYRVHDAAVDDREPLARGEWARFEGLDVTDRQRFSAGRLVLNDFHLLLRKQADGRWFGLSAGGQSHANVARAPTPPSDIYWRINHVAIESGDNTVQFEDHNVQPTFARTLHLQQFTASELDSSEPRRPSPVAFQGTVADGTRIVAIGKLRPFAEHLNLSLKTKIHRLPLPSLSPYSREHLGIEFKAGRLNIESTVHVIDGALRSDNQLLTRGLQLRTTGAPSQIVRERLHMPVPVALALLRDPDQVHRVEMPLRGDLDAPDFDLGRAVDQALGSALHDAALSTVRNTLQPFGTAEAGDGVHNGNGLLLEPLLFRAGSAALNTVTDTYLRRVAALLKLRPTVHLQICAVTTESDRAVANALPTLGRNRTTSVMKVLTDSYGIDPKRLQACTQNEAVESGRPRAELMLL